MVKSTFTDLGGVEAPRCKPLSFHFLTCQSAVERGARTQAAESQMLDNGSGSQSFLLLPSLACLPRTHALDSSLCLHPQ